MDFSQVRELLDQECTFPVDQETLVQQLGDIELDAVEAQPTDAETIETVLSRTGESTYQSVNDAYHAIIGTVTDTYIGRKYYDDRGGARHSTHRRGRDRLTGGVWTNSGHMTEPSGTVGRTIDIEDQGQRIDAGEAVRPDVAPLAGDETTPGPVGAGAREATQKSGEAPTELLDIGR